MTKSPLTIEFLLADESFQRWLSQSASTDEDKRWSNWLQSDFRHEEIHKQALELWQLVRFQPAVPPEINQELRKLQHRINLKLEKRASIIDIDLSSKRDTFRWIGNVREFWFRYAAVAAAIIVILLAWHYIPIIKHTDSQPFQTVSTEFGQRVQITLPEVATIVLNANSSLEYPTDWTDKTVRHFKLQGEAYFTVFSQKQGRQNHFVVSTNDGKVQVVGTRFVVYDRGLGTRVAVEKGCVEVFVAADSSKSNKDTSAASIRLKPGDLLKFQKGDLSLHSQSVNVLVYSSWWSDQLVLDNSSFEDIIRRLEETYSVNIKVSEKSLLKRCLSGSIENSSLQIITEALGKALQVPVHREGKSIIFGESFDKGK